MKEDNLSRVLERIRPLDPAAMEAAQRRLDSLTKPPGSLGQLEELGKRLAGITGQPLPRLDRKAVIVMAADHGVTAEGVSAYPSSVTGQMVYNFLSGGAAVNVLARQAGADVHCVDIGVDAELAHPRLLARKVRRGTANMCEEPAMTREEAVQAVMTGIDIAGTLAAEGCRLFATGDMGIGNTTASAAIASVLCGFAPEAIAGRGTGVDDAGVRRKALVIARAVERSKPDPDDPLDVLAKVGGLEIAGLAGVILGAAAVRAPVVIDGFISTAAALVAARLCPASAAYMIASHLSHEQGHRALLQAIGLSPAIHLDMRLGEGTGAVLCMHLIEASLRIMREMATFEEAGIAGGPGSA